MTEETELWTLLQGLEIAWERGMRRLKVEVESLKVVQWMQGREGKETPFADLIEERKKRLRRS